MATNDAPAKIKATHHLTNMNVKEVSFVRSGANGRNKFLLAKTDETPVEAPAAAANAATPESPAPFIAKALALAAGESLDQFRCKLCEALCDLLNPGEIQGRDPWLRAVYEDRVIAQQGWDSDSKLLELPYTRTGDDFKFGDAKLVEEVVTYEPAQAEKTAPTPAATSKDDTNTTPQGDAAAASGAHTSSVEGSTPSPATAPVTEPVAPAAPAEVDKTAQQKLLLHRRVWEMVHHTLDGIIQRLSAAPAADETPAATDTTEAAPVDATKGQPAASAPVPQTVEIKLPDALQKALEQVPELAAEVQELRRNHAALAKERSGSMALPGETPSAPPPEPDWRSCDDLNAWREQQRQSRR